MPLRLSRPSCVGSVLTRVIVLVYNTAACANPPDKTREPNRANTRLELRFSSIVVTLHECSFTVEDAAVEGQ